MVDFWEYACAVENLGFSGRVCEVENLVLKSGNFWEPPLVIVFWRVFPLIADY